MKIIVAATGVILAGSTPVVRREKVTTEITTDPEALATKLTRIANDTAELAAKANQGESTVFQDVELPATGNTIRLQHNLNKRVMWRVVDWTDPATGVNPTTAPGLVRSALDTTPNTLVLRSYVAGRASIEVF